MTDGVKNYKIVINGIEKSIDAVTSLNSQLDVLERRIDALARKSINIKVDGNVSAPKADASGIQEEARAQEELNNATKETIRLRAEDIQKLSAGKDTMKEFMRIAKEAAAQKALDINENDLTTMNGMKQQLKDIKTVMGSINTESDKFKELQGQANEINTKLKNIEAGYGQYGRNVGNYAEGVAEGMNMLKIKVGDTERSFASAREASRTLRNELQGLALAGKQGTKEYQDLEKTFKQLESTIKDVSVSSKGMDFLLDSMKGITAIASTAKGLSSFFNFDDSKVQKTVQQLLALQTAMQGIEQVQKLMKTEEGIVGWIAKGNSMIDSFAEKLTGAGKAQATLNTEMKAGKTAAEGLAVAETAQATATGLATAATKALGMALKAIGIGLVISLVSALVTHWKDLYGWITNTIPALRNISKWFDSIRKVAMGVGESIMNWMVQPMATLVQVVQSVINGNFSEVPKIIGQGLKRTFNVVGNYQKGYHKEAERQQERHNNKMREQQKKANDEMLKDEEAKYGKSHQRTQEYYRKQMALTKEGSDEYKELQRKLWEDERTEREENERKRNSTSKSNSNLTDETRKAYEELNNIRLELMKEGLTKELKQLDENNRKRRAEIIKNYQNDIKLQKQLLDAQEQLYAKEKEDILRNYNIESFKLINDNTIRDVELEINRLNNVIDDSLKARPAFIQPVSSQELKNIIGGGKEVVNEVEKIQEAVKGIREKGIAEATNDYTNYYKYLISFMKEKYSGTKVFAGFLDMLDNVADGKGSMEDTMEYAESLWKKYYSNVEDLAMRYGNVFEALQNDETTVLAASLDARMAGEKAYFAEVQKLYDNQIKLRIEKEKAALAAEQKAKDEDLVRRANQIGTEIDTLKSERANTTDEGKLEDINNQISALQRRYEALLNEQAIVADEYAQKIVEVDRKTNDTLMGLVENGFSKFTSNIRDYLTEMDKIESKQPVLNKLGFIDYKATKKQFDEIKNTATASLKYIDELREQLEEKFNNGLISPEARAQTEKELNSLEISINTRLGSVERRSKELPMELAKQINEVFQILGQAAVQVLGSIDQIQQAAFEKELEGIEKHIEKLEEAYDKQKELTEKYADNVNDIEDELSGARGDRRQHLIDQLNAQIAAQRESWAEERRIEKEKEAMEKKKEKLEEAERKRKKKNAITQALINAALAISSAAVNTWPIPAIPMIAAATAVGAAQVAAVTKAKYAEGGVIEGKSHAQGGVKVLGGRAEVEGGEFITNKNTTAKNADLLYYINSKRKKVSLDDMIEFYSTKPRAALNGMRNRFAQGGTLPTINGVDINDRLLDAFESYANTPTVVQVVDIIDRTKKVNQVRVLAGDDI